MRSVIWCSELIFSGGLVSVGVPWRFALVLLGFLSGLLSWTNLYVSSSLGVPATWCTFGLRVRLGASTSRRDIIFPSFASMGPGDDLQFPFHRQCCPALFLTLFRGILSSSCCFSGAQDHVICLVCYNPSLPQLGSASNVASHTLLAVWISLCFW